MTFSEKISSYFGVKKGNNMNYKILTLSAVMYLAITGCASTGSSNGTAAATGGVIDNNGLLIAESEPTLQTTTVAQNLEQWPYERSKLTYKLVNKDLVAISTDVSQWKKLIEETLTNKLTAKGLTKTDGNANLTISYGVVTKSESNDKADLMFDSLGLTTGGTSHGVNNSIDIVIKDNRSGREIWSGAASTLTDKPLVTEAQKRRAVNSVLESLTRKLPVAK